MSHGLWLDRRARLGQPGTSAAGVAFGGAFAGAVGTSLSAPEFAGLPLYELAAANTAFPYRFFHQTIPGSNGITRVGSEPQAYNPIVGVGTPYAANFLGFPTATLAGDPQARTNP